MSLNEMMADRRSASRSSDLVKRALDVVGAVSALIVLSPVMLVVPS